MPMNIDPTTVSLILVLAAAALAAGIMLGNMNWDRHIQSLAEEQAQKRAQRLMGKSTR